MAPAPPRWVFHFTLTSSSWLNAVEGFFAKLSKRPEARTFRSLVDLQATINRFIAEHNQTPEPFTWRADPDAIIAARKRGFQALSQSTSGLGPHDDRAQMARLYDSASHRSLAGERPLPSVPGFPVGEDQNPEYRIAEDAASRTDPADLRENTRPVANWATDLSGRSFAADGDGRARSARRRRLTIRCRGASPREWWQLPAASNTSGDYVAVLVLLTNDRGPTTTDSSGREAVIIAIATTFYVTALVTSILARTNLNVWTIWPYAELNLGRRRWGNNDTRTNQGRRNQPDAFFIAQSPFLGGDACAPTRCFRDRKERSIRDGRECPALPGTPLILVT